MDGTDDADHRPPARDDRARRPRRAARRGPGDRDRAPTPSCSPPRRSTGRCWPSTPRCGRRRRRDGIPRREAGREWRNAERRRRGGTPRPRRGEPGAAPPVGAAAPVPAPDRAWPRSCSCSRPRACSPGPTLVRCGVDGGLVANDGDALNRAAIAYLVVAILGSGVRPVGRSGWSTARASGSCGRCASRCSATSPTLSLDFFEREKTGRLVVPHDLGHRRAAGAHQHRAGDVRAELPDLRRRGRS